MNKKEQAMVEALKTRLALRFTADAPIQPDLPPPKSGEPMTTGYLYNTHSHKAVHACSTTIYHGYDSKTEARRQQPMHLYSTKTLALRALRQKLEEMYAEKLRGIDRQIEAEEEVSR
jgi:hypothetical protein